MLSVSIGTRDGGEVVRYSGWWHVSRGSLARFIGAFLYLFAM